MANNEPKPRTNQIVDFESIKKDMVSKLLKNHSTNHTAGYINARDKSIATAAMDKLRKGSKTDKGGQTLAPQTFYRYVSALRTAIKESGIKNALFIKTVKDLAETTSNYKRKLTAIAEADYLQSEKLIEALIDELREKETTLKRAQGREDAKNLKNVLVKAYKIIDSKALLVAVRSEEDYIALKPLKQAREDVKDSDEQSYSYEFEPVAKLIPKLLTSSASGDGWIDLMIGIALATGRRAFEIGYLTDFKTAPANKAISVRGLAKKKDSREERHEAITIPTLISNRTIMKAIERLRSSSRISELKARIDAVKGYQDKNKLFNGSTHKQLNERTAELLGERIIQDSEGKPVLKMVGNRPTGISFKITRDLYINMKWDEYLADNPDKATSWTFKRKWVADHLAHENKDSADSYDKMTNRKQASKLSIKMAQKHSERFADTSAKRLKELKAYLASEEVQARKVLVKAMTYIVEKVEADNEYVISSYSLRNAVPKPDGGMKPICKPAIISELMSVLKEKELDKPA